MTLATASPRRRDLVADRSDPQPGGRATGAQRRRHGDDRAVTRRPGVGAEGIPGIVPDSNGKPGPITLDPGDAGEPEQGLAQAGVRSGRRGEPPGVRQRRHRSADGGFPRNGAEIDCEQPDPQGAQIAIGTLPYPQDVSAAARDGRDRAHAAGVRRRRDERRAAAAGATDGVRDALQPGPGPARRLLLPGARSAGERDAGRDRRALPRVRAPGGHADEPHRHRAQAAALPDPARHRGHLRWPRRNGGDFTNLPPPGQAGPLVLGASNCGFNATAPASILCALPHADVNVRVNGRLYTQRADDDGKWALPIPLPVGWNHLTLAQVSDSRVGGAWSESCLSNEIDVGVQSPGAPIITVPPDITVDATGPKGAQVSIPTSPPCVPPTAPACPSIAARLRIVLRGRTERGAVHRDQSRHGRGRPGRVRDHRHRRSALDQGAEPDAGGDRPGRHDTEGVHQRHVFDAVDPRRRSQASRRSRTSSCSTRRCLSTARSPTTRTSRERGVHR